MLMGRDDQPGEQNNSSPELEGAHQVEFQWSFLAPRYWPTWSFYLLCVFLRPIPIKVLNRLADRFANLLVRGNGRRKQLAMANLSLCFPELSAAERLSLYHRHARILTHVYLNYAKLLFGNTRSLLERVDTAGEEIIQQLRDTGKNIILFLPHSLAFEYIGQWCVLHYPVVSVVRTHNENPLLDWIVTRFRTRFGAKFVSSTASMRPLIRSVRAGNFLFYLPDEDQGQANAVFAPFYGVAKATMPTLARLARACNAQVIPVVSLYDPDSGRFQLRFEPPMKDLTDTDPVEVAAQINQVIEHIIDVDRAQYMWSAKVFRTRPAGEKKLY